MDLNDAVDANLILAAKNDHHECQSLQRINSIVVRQFSIYMHNSIDFKIKTAAIYFFMHNE